ncbi:MAG: DUF3830 family protein [Actinobacteria bacterium]|nr:DUF3830 family protein [Actinomycetota bacterium]
MRLTVELPDKGVVAAARLYTGAAPTVTGLIHGSLAEPLETRTAHACFDGHEVYCFLRPFAQVPPIENRCMRPRPGELMFFHAAPNELQCTADDRLNGGSKEVFELAFIYGDADLRHYWEEGFHGSLVGRMEDGAEQFADACAATLNGGATAIRISREAAR